MSCEEFRRTLWDNLDAGGRRPPGHAASCPACALYAARAARLHAALPAAFAPAPEVSLADAVLAELRPAEVAHDPAGRPIVLGSALAAAAAWAGAAWLGWPLVDVPRVPDPMTLDAARAAWAGFLAPAAAAPSAWVLGLLAASALLCASLVRGAEREGAGR